MTLTQFFYSRYLPEMEAKDRSKLTVIIYENALDYWGKLMDDPPLEAVDGKLVDAFRQRLTAVTYTRAFELPIRRNLHDATQQKHLRSVRSLLRRAGLTNI